MLSRKMSGSMKYSDIQSVGKKLKEISEIITAYDLANKLSSDDVSKYMAIAQQFSEMTIQGETIESILGKNYRVNLFKNGNIEFNFKKIVIGHETAESIKNKFDSFPFESRSSIQSKGFSQFEVSCNMKLGQNVDFEKVMELISNLKIE